ncbi:hypothetical protein [Spiroplasma endosymbiont of Eupeodes luniger]|uniref:hypothetical protein n=1 Tax=Spiroplasma endosymbiont of Eupeodes luniger TaxID=3066300 RepID=UPI0030CE9B59
MNNNKFNTLNDKEWLRLTGIKKSTFNKMLDILQVAETEKFKKGGKTNKLSLENRLLDFLHNLLKKLQIFVKRQ